MLNEIINAIFYIFAKLLNFLFGAYIFEGVSLGMIFVVSFVFTIMLKFLLAVPKVRGSKRVQKGTDNSSNSSSND